MAETGYASLGLAQTAAADIHTARLAEFAKYGYTISGSSIIPKSLKTGQDDLVAPACSAWDSNPRNVSSTYYVKDKPTLSETAPFDMVNPNRYIVKKSATVGKTVDVIKYTYPDFVTPTSTTSYAYDEVTKITLSDGTGDTSTSDTIRAFGEDAFVFIDRSAPLYLRQLLIEKGRRVVVIGGHLIATHDGAPGIQGLLYFYNQKDKVHCEGLIVDANNKYGLDCIEYGGNTGAVPLRKADHTFLNIRAVNANSTSVGLHSDCLQHYGTTGSITVKNFTFTTCYQGIFIYPIVDVGPFTLQNMNGSYTKPDDEGAKGALLFIRNQLGDSRRPAISLANIYLDNRDNCPDWNKPRVITSGIITAATTTVLTDTSKNWVPNSLNGMVFWVISGAGQGWYKTVTSNTENTLYFSSPFAAFNQPDATSHYIITDGDNSVIKPHGYDVDTNGTLWGSQISADEQSVTFPYLGGYSGYYGPVTGTIYRGKPPGGDYAPERTTGLKYQFPRLTGY